MFLGKKHYSYSASLHPGVKMSDSNPIRGVKAEGGCVEILLVTVTSSCRNRDELE